MNNYQLSDELVKNKFCTVYKGRKRNTAEFYAILSMDKSRRDRVLRSVQTLRVLTHPSIVSFHNWYETSNHLWVITEYCSSGDMHSVLSLKDPLHPTSVRAYSRDAVLGLLYIHTRGVLYNNVKPSKLLLDSSCTLRYFDFGLSCLFTEAKDRSPVGTPLYMAPELFISGVGVPSVASDIWSLGCFMYELAAGQPPFSSEKLEDLMKEVQGSSYKPVERMDAEFNRLVQSMLEKDPLRRATWKDVVESGFWGEKITQDVHLPPEPAFDAYKRRYSGREWSAERLRLGLSRSIAAARFRQGQKNLESEDVSYLHGDLGATVEVDFTPLDAPVQDDEDEVDQGGKGAVPSSETVANPRSRSAEAAASATVDTQRSEILSIPPNHSCPSIHPTANINQVPTPPLKPAPLPATGWVETPAEKDLEATSMQEERHEVFSNSQSAPESLDQSNFTGFTVEGSSAETLVSEMRLASLLWQNADAHIRPLCLNNRLERYVEPTYNPELLEFQPYSASEIKKISREELTQFLAVIYRALSSTTVSASDKLNTLRYFEAVCVGTSTASVLVNSSIMTLCMKLCDQPNAAVEFRAAAASIIGLLVRHTTFIHTNLAKSGIFPDTLKLFWTEKDVMVRRKLLACSGEMLFYIAVQAAKDRPAWGIIPKDVLAVYQAALSSEDEILQHYAVKTIENLASVPDNEIVSSIFCNPATVDLLIRIYKTRSSNEQMASSALCAALKLAIGCESLMSHIFKSKDFPCSSYATTFSDCKVFYTAQLLITFLNYVMVKSMMAIDNSFTKAWIAAAAAEDEKSSRNRDQGPATSSLFVGSNVTPTDAVWMLTTIAQMSDELLVHLCNKDQQANVIIRGKTLLFTLLLGCLGGNTLSKLCESSHHVTYLDRLMRYKDSYVQRCASQMAVVLSLVVLEKIKVTSERVSFHSTAVYLSSTLQILSASAIRSMLQLQPDVFAYLAVCMDKSLTNSIYRNYLDRFVGIAERLTQNAEVVLQYAIPICQHIVKPFAHMLQRNSGAQRFAALRFLSTVMTPLLSDVQESSMSSKDSPPHETTAAAVEMVASAIINVLPELLTELPPLPSNALRLLVLCAEWMPKKPQYLGTESMADIIVQYVDKLSPDEEPDLLYPMKLLQIVFGSSSKRPDIALHAPRKEGNFLLLLRLALSSSYAKGQGQEVDCFCAVAVRVVLAYASAGNATLTANQCATFCEAEILGEVLLPLSVADARAPWGSDTAVNASMLVYHSVRLNRDSQPPLLSRKGLTSVALCLSEFNSVSSSSSSTVAGARDLAASNVLKGLRYVCECRPKDHVKRLVGQHQSLVSELWRVCEHRPKSIAAAEATRILEFL